jgi:malonyl-CoA O-methyltransferase
LHPRTLRDSFDLIAARYDHHAALEQEVGNRLLDRVEFRRREPERILDLGCGTGASSALLKQKFRRARVLGLDASAAMLALFRRRSSRLKPLLPMCADLARLPLAAQSIDLVSANMAVHWCADPPGLFSEVRRILRPGGMFLFSTLGASSLEQLCQTWREIDGAAELPAFPDLLELGDALVAAGFREPVMDTDLITLSYPTLQAMCEELEGTGNALLFSDWEFIRKCRDRFDQVFAAHKAEGRYPLTFEVVYGVAFGPEEGQPRRVGDSEVATFSVDSLLKNRRRKVPPE